MSNKPPEATAQSAVSPEDRIEVLEVLVKEQSTALVAQNKEIKQLKKQVEALTAQDPSTFEIRLEALEKLLADQEEALSKQSQALKAVEEKKTESLKATELEKRPGIPKDSFEVGGVEYRFLVPRFNIKFGPTRNTFIAEQALKDKEVLTALVEGKHFSVIAPVS